MIAAKRPASIGEPFLSSVDTAALQARLRELGASAIDDFGPQRLAAASGRAAENDRGGHIVHLRF